MADNISEEPKTNESLKALVKHYVLENYHNGYESDDENPLFHLMNNVDRHTDLTKEGADGSTTIMLMPAEAIPGIDAAENVKRANLEPNDVVIVYSLNTQNSDRFGRGGLLRGILVMSIADTNKFTSEIWSNPDKFYSLLRELNGKPLVRKDVGATPAKVLGNKIKLLANKSFGGTIDKNYEVQFKPGYDPSPRILT